MRICVYCSSSTAVDEVYGEAARELGRIIGSGGHSLIYGGCNLGLMGELARAVTAAGGHVIGVIPRQLRILGLGYEEADDLIVVDTLAERKALMEKHAAAFVALPGGFGTLEELAEVLTLKQLGQVQGPIVLLNIAGFYDCLLAHFERLFEQHFARADTRQLYHVAYDPRAVMDYIEGYTHEDLPAKWF